jgi:FtsZ-interacting cell division protein ZipA
MNTIPVFLADVDSQDPLAWWRLTNPAFRERLIIFGAIGLVTLLVLLWAAFIRSKRRRRHSHHHRHHHTQRPAEVPAASQNEDVPASPEKRRRRRHSHHGHRPRNPTLAETGGLPPIRSESPPEAEP